MVRVLGTGLDPMRWSLGLGLGVVLLVGLAGCGSWSLTGDDGLIRDHSVDYKQARSLPPLEVPPDLTMSSADETMAVPDVNPKATATYSEYAAERGGPGVSGQTGVLVKPEGVRVARDGDKRWLVIEGAPAEVWPKVRDFWLQNGFLLKREEPAIGILETDWAENRADIPQDPVRRVLSKVLDQVYSAATRDKFRVRLERGTDPGTTEVYLTHFGVEEKVQGDTSQAGATSVWQNRPRDPELEAEMLNRLMVYLGVEERKAATMLAGQATARPAPTLSRSGDGSAVLLLQEDFSRAWRRTGLALDRSGFTVEDRDRSRGVYYVRYLDPLADNKGKKGFLSKMAFWRSDDGKKGGDGAHYLVRVAATGDATQVTVLDSEGRPETSETAYRILTLLQEQLK